MKTLIIILFYCSFVIVLLLLGYIILPNGSGLNRQASLESAYSKMEYVIVQFYVEKGEVQSHTPIEAFASFESAQKRLQALSPAGFFWTGLHEYKIVERVDGVYQKCYDSNVLHNQYLAVRSNA